MLKIISIYVTHNSLENAKKIGQHLLKKKLIACANYFPINSSYLWQGEVKNGDEYVSLLKTKAENWEKVKAEIADIHPYDTPCILKYDVEGNQEYEDWVCSEIE